MKEVQKLELIVKGLILVIASDFIDMKETLYFIRVYGWHWTAINDWELLWDIVATILNLAGGYYFFKGLLTKEIE